MAETSKTTKIIVTEMRVTAQGKTKAGADYTLYQVLATKPDGQRIDLNLRSFTDLPKNEVIEVDVELYESDTYGKSYTLKRKGGGGGGGGSKKLAESVDELRQRVERIEAFLQGRGEFGGTAPAPAQAPPPQPAAAPPQAPPPVPPAAPPPPAVPPQSDDIPF
jgi:hypothetical protein